MHSTEIVQEYKLKNEKKTLQKINVLSKKLNQYKEKRIALENNYNASIDSVKFAKDETHRLIFSNDTAYYHKALLDFDFIYQNEMDKLPHSISNLQQEFATGLKKIVLTTGHKKFGIYRINEFRKNNTLMFWVLLIVVASLFLMPYYIRFKMILRKSSLDIALEEKIISKIKKEYRLNQEELHNYFTKFGVPESENEMVYYEDAPFIKSNNDNGELIALKNQMNIFLNNEI
jgi:hypothetical protein